MLNIDQLFSAQMLSVLYFGGKSIIVFFYGEFLVAFKKNLPLCHSCTSRIFCEILGVILSSCLFVSVTQSALFVSLRHTNRK